MRRNVVSRSGDTMTGDLTMSSTGIIFSGTSAAASGEERVYQRAANVVTFAVEGSAMWEIDSNGELYNPTGNRAIGDSSTRIGGVFSNSAFNSSVASGSNAITLTVDGARVDFGTGASDYASSDATTVTFAGPVSITSPLNSDTTSATFSITSDTTAATLSTSVAAVTLNSTVTPDADDLMVSVLSGAGGSSVFSVDLEGDLFLDSDINSDVTGSSFDITSDTTAVTMSTTVAAITLAPTATPGANDLLVEVNDAAGNSILSVDLEADLFIGVVNTGTVNVGGNFVRGLGDSTTFSITSASTAVTASSTVAAITLAPTATLDENDLVVEANSAAGTSLFTVDLEGDAIITGALDINGSTGVGTITLSSGTGTATVFSGAICVCTDTTANVSVKCAVSGTTLTATGTTSDVIAYQCH